MRPSSESAGNENWRRDSERHAARAESVATMRLGRISTSCRPGAGPADRRSLAGGGEGVGGEDLVDAPQEDLLGHRLSAQPQIAHHLRRCARDQQRGVGWISNQPATLPVSAAQRGSAFLGARMLPPAFFRGLLIFLGSWFSCHFPLPPSSYLFLALTDPMIQIIHPPTPAGPPPSITPSPPPKSPDSPDPVPVQPPP